MAITKEYYKDLSIEELAQDDFFIQSMKVPDEKTAAFWKEFVLDYPNRKNEVEEAGRLVESLKFFDPAVPSDAKERIWTNILS